MGFAKLQRKKKLVVLPSKEPLSFVPSLSEVEPFEEQHYKVNELSMLWGYSRQFLMREFLKEPDILNHHRPATEYKRVYNSPRIPRSVAIRVHSRLKNKAA